MIKQKQLFRHRPHLDEIGDCHRTAIACLLDMRPEDVPHFGELSWDFENKRFREGESFHEHVDAFLASVGLARIETAWKYDNVADVLHAQGVCNPRAYYLLGGESRTGVNHTVIGHADKIIWDPSLDDSGIVGPCQPDGLYWVTHLVPLRLTAEPAATDGAEVAHG